MNPSRRPARGVLARRNNFGARRETPGREARQRQRENARRRPDEAGSKLDGRLGKLPPRAGIGRENPERLPLAGQHLVALVDGVILERMRRSAECAGRGGDFLLHYPAEWVGIAIEENRLRAGLGKEFPQFLIGVPLADDEAPAKLPGFRESASSEPQRNCWRGAPVQR